MLNSSDECLIYDVKRVDALSGRQWHGVSHELQNGNARMDDRLSGSCGRLWQTRGAPGRSPATSACTRSNTASGTRSSTCACARFHRSRAAIRCSSDAATVAATEAQSCQAAHGQRRVEDLHSVRLRRTRRVPLAEPACSQR
jgi:hypothetical protein